VRSGAIFCKSPALHTGPTPRSPVDRGGPFKLVCSAWYATSSSNSLFQPTSIGASVTVDMNEKPKNGKVQKNADPAFFRVLYLFLVRGGKTKQKANKKKPHQNKTNHFGKKGGVNCEYRREWEPKTRGPRDARKGAGRKRKRKRPDSARTQRRRRCAQYAGMARRRRSSEGARAEAHRGSRTLRAWSNWRRLIVLIVLTVQTRRGGSARRADRSSRGR
jgi:hypothetical protein